jgi:uncharacterized BrkB/YihY/UPF0761 family membrane protein
VFDKTLTFGAAAGLATPVTAMLWAVSSWPGFLLGAAAAAATAITTAAATMARRERERVEAN